MKTHAGIIIGIDEYQFFQPLTYAKQDAQGLENFLVEKARFASDRCVLLTDTSPELNSRFTYPNRENIVRTIDNLCQQLHPEDVLWFFFSGYGVSWHEEDYLMPMEGKAEDVPGTGISMRALYRTLKSCPAKQVLVLLDMNRATGTSADEKIGLDTVALAREMEISTAISCQHNQFSRETAALQHGFFTAALLEALDAGQCKTLESLDRFLGDRLPELCEQHFRPRQDPIFVYSPEKQSVPVLPTLTQTVATREGLPVVPVRVGQPESHSREATGDGEGIQPQMGSGEPIPVSSLPGDPSATALQARSPEPSRSRSKWLLLGGAVGLILLLGILLVEFVNFVDRESVTPEAQAPASPVPTRSQAIQPVPSPVADPAQPPVAAAPPSNASPSQDNLDKAILSLEPAQAHQFSQAIAQARQVPKGDPLYEDAQKNIDRWGQVISDIAVGRAKQGNYEGAIAAAKLVPEDRPQLQGRLQELLPFWQQQQKLDRANQQRLLEAQKLIRPGQASTYSKAIAKASEIPAGQPQYQQAQELINLWSEKIWQIAQYRASRRRFTWAIQAAKLVPENTTAYPAARDALERWESALQ